MRGSVETENKNQQKRDEKFRRIENSLGKFINGISI